MSPTGSAGAGLPIEHRAWLNAREQALEAVRAGDGLILVLGPPGTGKSLLLRDIARILGGGGYDVLFQARGDIPVEADGAAPGDRRPLPRIVLVDEADRITAAALERLSQLGAAPLICAGLTAAAAGLVGHRATVVRLAPLAPDEVGPFAAARLARAGRQGLPLEGRAIWRLAERSGGVPRVLTMLVDAAAFHAAMEGALRIEASHVDEAAAMRANDAFDDAPPPEAEPDGAAPLDAAVEQEEAPPQARQAAVPPGQGSNASDSGGAAAARDGVAPDAPAVRSEPDAVPAEIIARDLGPAGQVAGHASHRNRAAALCAAAGAAALCGWLVLRPGPPPPQIAPAPDRPSASTALEAPHTLPARPVSPAPQAAEAAPPPVELPAEVPGHVAIYHPQGDAAAAARAADLARVLRAAGMVVDNPVAVPRQTRPPGVRYFFAEDRTTAGAVLGWAGLPSGSLRSGAARPGLPPRPGAIEVMVPPG